eukprot:COSAG02_NODE_5633_length_4170_cov_2.964628_1_plen_62_part_00
MYLYTAAVVQGGNEVMLRRIEELVEEIDRVHARVEEHRRLVAVFQRCSAAYVAHTACTRRK